MNISKLTGGTNSSSQTRNEPVKKEEGHVAKAQTSANFADQVKLSASSKSMQQIEAEIRDMPEVDDATVERIRTAIEKGEYKIDYSRLAGKMLDFEDDLN
ncbi:flagellar biosynthesis anti-sigma factor FlgM [Thalassolituus sp. LLYu03]|uniref:flagellar biosynthesis anti-sigma factor FlgM n=1 Tax=Thalassolituus sp. LLYu03 TaxID=3421656 RepID=UPI003D26D67E